MFEKVHKKRSRQKCHVL